MYLGVKILLGLLELEGYGVSMSCATKEKEDGADGKRKSVPSYVRGLTIKENLTVTKNPGTSNTHRGAALKRWFGSSEVVDAKTDLYINVTKADIAKSKPGDICNCAFSTAAKRTYGSKSVLFMGTVAYVDLPLPTNPEKRQICRFINSRVGVEFIRTFDADKEKAQPGGFFLKAPAPSHTLEAKATSHRRQDHRRRAAMKGIRTGDDVASGKLKTAVRKTFVGVRVNSFRNGQGMVQFVKEKVT